HFNTPAPDGPVAARVSCGARTKVGRLTCRFQSFVGSSALLILLADSAGTSGRAISPSLGAPTCPRFGPSNAVGNSPAASRARKNPNSGELNRKPDQIRLDPHRSPVLAVGGLRRRDRTDPAARRMGDLLRPDHAARNHGKVSSRCVTPPPSPP